MKRSRSRSRSPSISPPRPISPSCPPPRPPSSHESDVGITQYLRSGIGFIAILKQRFYDFIVHEIDSSGFLVQLTSSSVPSEFQAPLSSPAPISYDKKPEGLLLLEQTTQDPSFISSMKSFLDSPSVVRTISLPSPADKETRRVIHGIIRDYFGDSLTSVTMEIDKKSFIQVFPLGFPSPLPLRSSSSSSSSNNRTAPPPNFLQFVLFKWNIDTITSISMIARKLGLKESSFGFAGTKDKRAYSSQLVTVKKCHPSKLVKVSGNSIRVGNFKSVEGRTFLGNLQGNRFTIVLRSVSIPPETLDECLLHWKERNYSFINYFGLQRFGTSSVSTWKFGSLLFQEKHVDLINQVFSSVDSGNQRGSDSSTPMQRARDVWLKSNDANLALSLVPPFYYIERGILSSIAKSQKKAGVQTELTNAIASNAMYAIPKRIRVLYLYSFQSYLWNQLASSRISTPASPFQPQVGDLVLAEKTALPSDELDLLDEIVVADDKRSSTSLPSVKLLTEDDILSNEYTFSDVIIPQPGFGTIFPTNHSCDVTFLANLMRSAGADIPSGSVDAVEAAIRSFFSPKTNEHKCVGGYRKLIETASDVQYKILNYTDPNQQLAATDEDIMRNASANFDGDERGEKVALRISFSLTKSAYATMALREIMKASTQKDFHSDLTKLIQSNEAVKEVAPDDSILT